MCLKHVSSLVPTNVSFFFSSLNSAMATSISSSFTFGPCLFYYFFILFWISYEIKNVFQFHPLLFFNLLGLVLILLITIFFLFNRLKITFFFSISPPFIFFYLLNLVIILLIVSFFLWDNFLGFFFCTISSSLGFFFLSSLILIFFYCYLFFFVKFFKLIFFSWFHP